ncbi:hypothetical protein BC826DRAFT_975722 [Russula brevipes]|nr:hypothetical protein BC826DRAFT_975722 [Russula brevipes]
MTTPIESNTGGCLALEFGAGGRQDQHDERVWSTLVHVCRRWRSVVSAWPRHLNIHLRCTGRAPTRDMLDVWPALPVFVEITHACGMPLKDGEEDNIIAALEHRDRVHRISLRCVLIPGLVAVMQEPFPELKDLEILAGEGTEDPVILLDSFLGGAAPGLRTLWLEDVRGPALQRLLLSAHDLTELCVTIPQDSVLSVSPEAMVTCLSTMTKLEDLDLYLPPIRSGLDPLGESGRSPPQTRTILSSLTRFRFEGDTEYLGDFVARIDAPLLDDIKITFDKLHFDPLQLLLFIGRAEKIKLLCRAELIFYVDRIELSAYPRTKSSDSDVLVLETDNQCTLDDSEESDVQLSSLARICAHSLPPFSTLERLDITGDPTWLPLAQGQLEYLPWVEFLRPFTSVKDLYLSGDFALRIAPVLHGLAEEGETEVLPVLQKIFVVGGLQREWAGDLVAEFVAARRRSGHILTFRHVRRWSHT